MGRKVKVQITSSGKHYVIGMLTFEIVVVAMTTTTGEVLRDSVVEPSPKTVSMTTPVVTETKTEQPVGSEVTGGSSPGSSGFGHRLAAD